VNAVSFRQRYLKGHCQAKGTIEIIAPDAISPFSEGSSRLQNLRSNYVVDKNLLRNALNTCPVLSRGREGGLTGGREILLSLVLAGMKS
jgi:hypothetical protein